MKRARKPQLPRRRASRRFGIAHRFTAYGGPADGGTVLLRTFSSLTIRVGEFIGFYDRGRWVQLQSPQHSV